MTAAQQQQVKQMAELLAPLKSGLSEILEIAEELKGKTIESMLGKSDAELALDILSGKMNLPI